MEFADDIDLTAFAIGEPAFRTHAEVLPALEAACAAHPDLARYEVIGESEEGRPIVGIVLGRGPFKVSLIAGNHADEPVGPETLRRLVLGLLERREQYEPLLERVKLVVVPHTNPDGEARNRAWIERWPDLSAYLLHVDREPPGRDLEFGFPDLRPENRAVSAFLRQHAPYGLHFSLHGMGFAEGVMLLIERQWAGRTHALRDSFRALAAGAGLPLHDHNREGEKGFFYIAPGFTTTPEGEAMRRHFQHLGDEDMASRFLDSSMEFVRSLGGDPLSVVTELPLFLIQKAETAGVPTHYLAFREALPAVRAAIRSGNDSWREQWKLQVLPLGVALRLQLGVVESALRIVLRPR